MSEVIRKSFKLLEAIKPTPEKVEWSATEISKKLEIPVQTVHRLLSSLEESGIVFKNKETKKFRVGLNLLQMGLSVRNNLLVRNSSIPTMKALAKDIQQSVYLTVPEGYEGVYIDCISYLPWLKEAEPIGMRVPLNQGSAQKVILAFSSPKSQRYLIQSLKEQGLIHDLKKLQDELKIVKNQYFAFSSGEITKGTVSISCPVFSWEDEVVASITVNGTIESMREDNFKQIVNRTKQAAITISEELGWISSLSKMSAVH